MKITSNFLKNKELKSKPKIAFTKLLADLFNKKHSLSQKDEAKDLAKENYEKTYNLIKESKLEASEPIYLTFINNYAIFMATKLNLKTEAINLCKEALEKITLIGIELKDKQQTDIVFLCQLLKDNMSLWKAELILNKQNVKIPPHIIKKSEFNIVDNLENDLNNLEKKDGLRKGSTLHNDNKDKFGKRKSKKSAFGSSLGNDLKTVNSRNDNKRKSSKLRKTVVNNSDKEF